jgi:hypothetical protein
MPVQYERDDARRRVVVTVQGAFQTHDMLMVARQRADEAWSYGLLYDLRHMTDHPTVAELRAVLDEAAARGAGEGPRGPVALVATDPILYGTLCAYAALGQLKLNVQVFHDHNDAAAWLAAETRHGHTEPSDRSSAASDPPLERPWRTE